MRIAYVTETWPPELNGVAATASRTVAWLRGRGHDVSVIRPRQSDEKAGESAGGEPDNERRDGELRVPGIALPMYPALRVGAPLIGMLKRRWQSAPPALVHVATEGPLGWAACRAARLLDLPLSSDLRTHFDLYSDYYGWGMVKPLVGRYLRAFHNATDRTFVPTRALAAQLRGRGFDDLSVVGRGVDAHRFDPALRSELLRTAWGARADDVVLLHVGRLAAEKNLPLALASFAAVREAVPRARLVIVGDGPQRAALQRSAGPGVLFTGPKSGASLAAHYASADVLLVPSLTETFGNVTLEGLASGLAVVAFDVAAAAVHIRHGVNGLLAATGDEDGFVRLAQQAAAAGAALQPLRDAARRAAERVSWDAVLTGFERELLQVAARGRAGVAAYAA